ncbi:MAG: hypothetical protein JRM80_14375 [Nitrososphaerota archaeon]|nr:hypothetical protein [Nitrososphaerota archaeon]MDG6991503.1 hypothetical protein [Nitrososphaerota archaeon]
MKTRTLAAGALLALGVAAAYTGVHVAVSGVGGVPLYFAPGPIGRVVTAVQGAVAIRVPSGGWLLLEPAFFAGVALTVAGIALLWKGLRTLGVPVGRKGVPAGYHRY